MKRTKHNQYGTILTNDPSMTGWGWAVLDWKGNVVEVGCIKTAPQAKMLRIRKGDDYVRRISEINQTLLNIIYKHNVQYILSELPHGSQSAVAAKMIGGVSAIVQTLCDTLKIGVEWYSENDAKKSLFDQKIVTKEDMQNKISKQYDVQWTNTKWRDYGIADALAIHYVASQISSTLKLFKNK